LILISAIIENWLVIIKSNIPLFNDKIIKMYCVSKIAKIAIKSFSLDEILLFYFFTKYAREKARAGNVINSL
jgi:hypothetical protein